MVSSSMLLAATLSLLCPALDFSGFALDRAKVRFDQWITVFAADGEVLDSGRWDMYFGDWSRAEIMEGVIHTLELSSCDVEQRGSLVVVKTYKKSRVTAVKVRTTGPGPQVRWVLRDPPPKKPKEGKK